MLKKFSIAEISTLDDGRPAAMVDKLLRIATEDCVNRPGVTKARRVTLSMEITPQANEDGVCDDVHIEFTSTGSVPKSRSKTFSMKPNPKGQLVFNDHSQDNVHQGTLDQSGGGMDAPIEGTDD